MINEHDLQDMAPGTPNRVIQKPVSFAEALKQRDGQVPMIAKQPAGGLKYDDGKSRMDLLDSEFLEGIGMVLGFGAAKYAAHNWRSGIPASRLIGGVYRHLSAFNRCEDNDPESGLSHLYHAACGLQFLAWMMKHRPDLDDRYKPTGLTDKG